jgi:hypothetical protein
MKMASCSTAADCGDPITVPTTGATLNWFCDDGMCNLMPCTGDSDCADINTCFKCDGGQCVPKVCGQDSDCGDKGFCQNGYCLGQAPPQNIWEVDYQWLIIGLVLFAVAAIGAGIIWYVKKKHNSQ